MKSLNTIQVLAKVGRILSKIIFILCIVGFCGCIIGIVSLALGLESFKIGDLTIRSIIEDNTDLSIATVYAGMAVGIVYCAAEAVLCKFSETYFKNELADGTPFTQRGAKELQRLGVIVIVVSLCAGTVCAIGLAIAHHVNPEIGKLPLESIGSVGIGIMMLIASLLCRYGAELREEKIEEAQINE